MKNEEERGVLDLCASFARVCCVCVCVCARVYIVCIRKLAFNEER